MGNLFFFRCILPLFFSFFVGVTPLSAVDSSKAEVDLSYYESTIYSQNGEDGIIEAIFSLIGTQSRYFVEFGGFDGYGMSNTRLLRDHKKWKGLMMDGFYENLSINLRKEFITAENINDLFAKYEVPYDLDLLSIDVDRNDFYIWKNLDEKYKPRLIIVEYNATHLPDQDKVVEYEAHGMWDYTNYYGASILSFYHLGRAKGYSLVYAEKNGVNLFFIRNDLVDSAPCTFKNINDVKALYASPKYGTGTNGGHVDDPLNRTFLRSVDLLKNK